MRPSKHLPEVYVGAFVAAGMALLVWMIFEFGNFSRSSGGSYRIEVEVKDATGIRTGVPVRLGGLGIGRVASDPVFNEGFTSLTIELEIFAGQRIPSGSLFKIGTSGLMGDNFIRVIPPETPSTDFLTEGQRVIASPGGSLDELTGDATDALEGVTSAAAEVRTAADRLETLFKLLDERIITEENVSNVTVMLSELRASSEQIHAASKKLNPLLDEADNTLKEVRGAASGAKEALSGIDEGMTNFSDTLSKIDPVLTEFDQSLDELRSTLNSANRLINTIENGGGLASALIKDPELKQDLESLLDKLERNGILFYPKEGGLLRRRDSSNDAPAEEKEKEGWKLTFPGSKKHP